MAQSLPLIADRNCPQLLLQFLALKFIKAQQRRARMKMTDLFLAELEREAAGTRRTLERVPEGRNDWKPHEKSMPLGYLAALVARMPAWIDRKSTRLNSSH